MNTVETKQLSDTTVSIPVNTAHYDILSEFFKKMNSFGVNVIGFNVEADSFCFFYLTNKQYHFTYDELEQLQAIIDPSIKNHDSIRIMGFNGTYTMRVKINR